MIATRSPGAGARGAGGWSRTSSSAGWPRRRRAAAARRWGPAPARPPAAVVVAGTARPSSASAPRPACRSAATGTPGRCGRPSAGVPPSSRWRGGRWRVPAREAAHAALGRRSTPGLRAVALGAAALTAWDLFLDPQMTAEGYWRWDRRGRYRGHPADQLRRLAGHRRWP